MEKEIKPMEKEIKSTPQDKLLDYINSSLITSLFLIFTIWWVTKMASLRNLPRKGLRIVAIFFYFVSLFCGIFCDWMIVFLATQLELNKNEVEKLGYLGGSLILPYKNIDLVAIYNTCLFINQVLKISTIFLLIASWVPFSFHKSQFEKENKSQLLNKISEASLASFVKYYSIFRIPIFVFFRMYQGLFDNDTILFIRSTILGSELALCALFLVILKTKYQGILQNENEAVKGNFNGINILITVLLFNSFFNYILHTLSIPLVFSDLLAFVVEKLGFLSELLCSIILLTLLCPQKTDKIEKKLFKNDIIPFELDEYKSNNRKVEIDSYELVDIMGPDDKPIQHNN